MELRVWVEGVERVVCGLTHSTTCQETIYALAHATGQTGRFVLVEQWRSSERSLAPGDRPLELLKKWGDHSKDVKFLLKCLDPSSAGNSRSSSLARDSSLRKNRNSVLGGVSTSEANKAFFVSATAPQPESGTLGRKKPSQNAIQIVHSRSGSELGHHSGQNSLIGFNGSTASGAKGSIRIPQIPTTVSGSSHMDGPTVSICAMSHSKSASGGLASDGSHAAKPPSGPGSTLYQNMLHSRQPPSDDSTTGRDQNSSSAATVSDLSPLTASPDLLPSSLPPVPLGKSQSEEKGFNHTQGNLFPPPYHRLGAMWPAGMGPGSVNSTMSSIPGSEVSRSRGNRSLSSGAVLGRNRSRHGAPPSYEETLHRKRVQSPTPSPVSSQFRDPSTNLSVSTNSNYAALNYNKVPSMPPNSAQPSPQTMQSSGINKNYRWPAGRDDLLKLIQNQENDLQTLVQKTKETDKNVAYWTERDRSLVRDIEAMQREWGQLEVQRGNLKPVLDQLRSQDMEAQLASLNKYATETDEKTGEIRTRLDQMEREIESANNDISRLTEALKEENEKDQGEREKKKRQPETESEENEELRSVRSEISKLEQDIQSRKSKLEELSEKLQLETSNSQPKKEEISEKPTHTTHRTESSIDDTQGTGVWV